MNNWHLLAPGLVVGSIAATAQGGTVTLVSDDRFIDVNVWAGDAQSGSSEQLRVPASFDEKFDQNVDLTATSEDGKSVFVGFGSQCSYFTSWEDGRFEIYGLLTASSGSILAGTGTPWAPEGFSTPLTSFDITIDATSQVHYELELDMTTYGDATAEFNALDLNYAIMPAGGEQQKFALAGVVESGAYRLYANVAAPVDAFSAGTRAELRFKLTGFVAPLPTAVASASAMLAAMLLRRKR